MDVWLTINRKKGQYRIAPNEILLDFLRRNGYTEVKCGCRTGECGACSVLLNDDPVNSCQILVGSINNCEIKTVQGIGTQREPNIIQQALAEVGAVQCGFCIPGMVISAYSLLERNPNPTSEQVCEALDGNLCRCTGYKKIVDGILLAAKRLNPQQKSSRNKNPKNR